MSFYRFDYSQATSGGARHGLIYEESAIIENINYWNWSWSGTQIYFEQEIYSPYDPIWREVKTYLNGNFNFSDYEYGEVDEFNSFISSGRIIYESGGSASFGFDIPVRVSDILDIRNIYDRNNFVNGSNFGDIIYGEGGDDVVIGAGGNDEIDGGYGFDKAVYLGPRNRYSVQLSPTHQLRIQDLSGAEGTDVLTGVEVVEFGGLIYGMEALRLDVLLSTPAQVSNQVRRLYNQNSGKHLFSANQTEIDFLTGGGYGWNNEGTSYLTPSDATAEVFRFYVTDEQRHFYTANESERDFIISNLDDFIYEGKAYDAYSIDDRPTNAVAVVRYYNSALNSHVYSTSTYEQSVLNQDSMWMNEGIAWYGDEMPSIFI